MKRMIALALCLLMAFTLLAGCGSSSAPAATTAPAANDAPAAEAPAEKITFSISHSYTELDQVSVELNTAAKNISERTNGNVTVNLFPNNTFGNMADGVEAVMSDSPLMLMAAFSQWEDM